MAEPPNENAAAKLQRARENGDLLAAMAARRVLSRISVYQGSGPMPERVTSKHARKPATFRTHLTSAERHPEVRPPSSVTCATCPWRVENQETPPVDKPGRVSDLAYYADEGRDELWENWKGSGEGARDGFRIMCHANWGKPELPIRWCAGADSIQARMLLRFFEGGCTREALGALSDEAAARMISLEPRRSVLGRGDSQAVPPRRHESRGRLPRCRRPALRGRDRPLVEAARRG